MDFLTDYKIPVGRTAEDIFDWLQTHGGWFFDGLADVGSWLIEWLLWLLQEPNPLIIVVLATALAYWLQRSWKVALFVALGFLFILNQGYWEETTESLTLVLSACVVCRSGSPPPIARAFTPCCSRSSI